MYVVLKVGIPRVVELILPIIQRDWIWPFPEMMCLANGLSSTEDSHRYVFLTVFLMSLDYFLHFFLVLRTLCCSAWVWNGRKVKTVSTLSLPIVFNSFNLTSWMFQAASKNDLIGICEHFHSFSNKFKFWKRGNGNCSYISLIYFCWFLPVGFAYCHFNACNLMVEMFSLCDTVRCCCNVYCFVENGVSPFSPLSFRLWFQ